MARAIIRYSLQRDNGTVHRRVSEALRVAGFQKGGTAVREHPNASLADLQAAVNQLMTIVVAAGPAVTLDHLWVYIDEGNGDDPDQP